MDPTPKMVIRTPLARRKGELEAASVAEIDELISTLCIAKVGMIAAAAAIAAGRLVEVAFDDDDVVDATIYCGERGPWGDECTLEAHDETERHVDTSDREWGGKPFAQPASPEAVAVLADSIAAGTPLLVDDDEDGPMDDEAELRRAEKLREDWEPVLTGLGERVAVLSEPSAPEPGLCDSVMPLPNGGRLKCTLDDYHDGAHSALAGMHRWIGTGMAARTEDGLRIAKAAPLASVTPLRTDSDVIPATQVPCPEAHPSRGTLCAGKIPHPMPHVDPDGETWVTEHATAIIGGAS